MVVPYKLIGFIWMVHKIKIDSLNIRNISQASFLSIDLFRFTGKNINKMAMSIHYCMDFYFIIFILKYINQYIHHNAKRVFWWHFFPALHMPKSTWKHSNVHWCRCLIDWSQSKKWITSESERWTFNARGTYF